MWLTTYLSLCLPGCYHLYLCCFCCPDGMIFYTHLIPLVSSRNRYTIVPGMHGTEDGRRFLRARSFRIRTVYGMNKTTIECRYLSLFCYNAELFCSHHGDRNQDLGLRRCTYFAGFVESRAQRELPVQFLYCFVNAQFTC